MSSQFNAPNKNSVTKYCFSLFAPLAIALLLLSLSPPTLQARQLLAEAGGTQPTKSAYITSVQERLTEAFHPAMHDKAKVIVLFRLSPQGKVSLVEVSDASSSTAVNTAATDSIYAAQPFPSLPSGEKFMDIEAQFESDLASSRTGGYCRPTRDQQGKAAKHYKEASELITAKDNKGALAKLEEALTNSPFNYTIKRKYTDLLLKEADRDKENAARYLHKAVLILPRDQRACKKLDQYWKEKGIDSQDPEKRYELAADYDKNGNSLEALAEYSLAWEMKPKATRIKEINLAAKHYRALAKVKKWQAYHKQAGSSQSAQLLANALKNAGDYKQAAVISGDGDMPEIESIREKELSEVSDTKLDASLPFVIEKNKKISVSRMLDRKRSVDYLAHAIKQYKAVIRWTPGKFPLKVFVRSGRGVKGYNPVFNQLVVEAFNKWSKASQNRLTFVQVGAANGANIVVNWTANPADLKGLTGREQGITHFKFMKASKGNYTIVGADINILTMRRSNIAREVGVKLMRPVILHELGHALGIAGHSPYSSDIMYPALNYNTRDLSDRDRGTIIKLYQGYEH